MCNVSPADALHPLLLRGTQSRTCIHAKLCEPAPGTECPIAMEPISETEVPGFEGFLFDENFPRFREVRLPCGHGFAASSLVAHWLIDNMICPLCRAGHDCPLRISALPPTWRERAEEYKRIRLRRDIVESSFTDQQNPQFIHFSMIVGLFSRVDGNAEPEVNEILVRCNTTINNSELRMEITRADMRTISAAAQQASAFGLAVRIYVQATEDFGLLPYVERSSLLTSHIMLLPETFWHALPADDSLHNSAVDFLEMSQPLYATTNSTASIQNSNLSVFYTRHIHDRTMDTITNIRVQVPTRSLLHLVSEQTR